MRKLFAAVVMGSALLFAAMPALAAGDLDGRSAELHQARLAPVSSLAQRPVIAPTSSPATSVKVVVGADDLPRAR